MKTIGKKLLSRFLTAVMLLSALCLGTTGVLATESLVTVTEAKFIDSTGTVVPVLNTTGTLGATITVKNNTTTTKTPTAVLAVYENGAVKSVRVAATETAVAAGASGTLSFSAESYTNYTKANSAKLFVFDDLSTLQPVCEAKELAMLGVLTNNGDALSAYAAYERINTATKYTHTNVENDDDHTALTDGDISSIKTTVWENSTATVTFDFGKNMYVTQADIWENFSNQYPNSMIGNIVVEGRTDGTAESAYAKFGELTVSDDGRTSGNKYCNSVQFSGKKARYVKITLTLGSSRQNMNLVEVGLLGYEVPAGEPDSTPTPTIGVLTNNGDGLSAYAAYERINTATTYTHTRVQGDDGHTVLTDGVITGLTTTEWSASSAEVIFDLGKFMYVTQADVWEQYGGDEISRKVGSVDVYGSTNGTTYTKMGSADGISEEQTAGQKYRITATFSAQKARYVKIVTNLAQNHNQMILVEMGLLGYEVPAGEADPTPTPTIGVLTNNGSALEAYSGLARIATSPTCTAMLDDVDCSAAMINGDTTDAKCTKYSYSNDADARADNVYFDLGTEMYVTQADVWEKQENTASLRSKVNRIEVWGSTDNANWTINLGAANGTTGDPVNAAINRITAELNSQKVRYVRVIIYQAGGVHRMQLSEVGLLGYEAE